MKHINLILIFLTMITGNLFSQSKLEIKYRNGYYGSRVDVDSGHSCMYNKDTVFHTFTVAETKGKLFYNANLLSVEKTDSLKYYLKEICPKIKVLTDELSASYKAKFVPPGAICCQYEEFSIIFQGKKYKYILINREMNKLWTGLKDAEVQLFVNLLKMIDPQINEYNLR